MNEGNFVGRLALRGNGSRSPTKPQAADSILATVNQRADR